METIVIKTLIVLIGSTLSVAIFIPKLIKYSLKQHWVDVPNKRASHVSPTPTSGGITFVVAVLISLMTSSWSIETSIIHFLLILIGLMGFFDDRYNLSPMLKLIIEAIMVLFIFSIGIDTRLLESIIGLTEMPLFVSLTLTFIVICGLVNAFNLIDGINGLAGGIALMNTLLFSAIFYFHGNLEMCLLHLSISGALLAFLKFNFNPAKIFMGDAGSLIIGLLMGISFLMALQFENPITSTLAFTMMIFPSVDMLRLFISRIINKRSPFSADKNHYHHLLLKAGDNHKQAAIICYLIHAAIIGVGALFLNWFSFRQANFLILTSSVVFYTIIEIRFLIIQRKKYKFITELLQKTIDKNQLLKRLY